MLNQQDLHNIFDKVDFMLDEDTITIENDQDNINVFYNAYGDQGILMTIYKDKVCVYGTYSGCESVSMNDFSSKEDAENYIAMLVTQSCDNAESILEARN